MAREQSMRTNRFRIGVCLIFLLLSLVVMHSCSEAASRTAYEEGSDTAEKQEDSAPETDAPDHGEEAFFPDGFLCLFHGSSQWGEIGHENLKVLSEAENPNPCMRLLMMRIAKDQEQYHTYQETLAGVYPPADTSGFPEIPEEWFRDNSLLTLFVVDDIVCDSIRITSRLDTGSGYYVFCESDKAHGLVGGTPDYKCGTLLVPVTKEQSTGWRDIGLFLYSKHETLQESIEEKAAALKTKYSKTVETIYKEAVWMQNGEDASEKAYLTIETDGRLLSDGLNNDVLFPVQIRLKNEALLFPEEATGLAAFGDLTRFRNAVYEEFASKHHLTWIEGDPPSDYYKVEDLSCRVPEWQLFLLVTVPELQEILNDDLVILVDFHPRSCDPVIR